MAESMVDSGITISLTFGSNVVESVGGLLKKRLCSAMWIRTDRY